MDKNVQTSGSYMKCAGMCMIQLNLPLIMLCGKVFSPELQGCQYDAERVQEKDQVNTVSHSVLIRGHLLPFWENKDPGQRQILWMTLWPTRWIGTFLSFHPVVPIGGGPGLLQETLFSVPFLEWFNPICKFRWGWNGAPLTRRAFSWGGKRNNPLWHQLSGASPDGRKLGWREESSNLQPERDTRLALSPTHGIPIRLFLWVRVMAV